MHLRWKLHNVSALLLVCYPTIHATAPAPFELQWSEKTYGPDGPWGAIKMYIGSQNNRIDLMPGANWWTNVLLPEFCSKTAHLADKCYAKAAGFYDKNNSKTSNNSHVSLGTPEWTGALEMGGTARAWEDTITFGMGNNNAPAVVKNCSLLVTDYAYAIYPDGRNRSVTIGQLSLGGWTVTNGASGIDGALPPIKLYQNGIIPSPSFALHMGSVQAGIPGSLWFGGYDQTRAIGRVKAQPSLTVGIRYEVSLRNINVTSTSDISNPDILGPSFAFKLPVMISAGTPYMFLPESVCEAMIKNLPIAMSKQLGYYLWETQDPRYEMLVNSSSYFTFTFGSVINAEEPPLHIRVPFKLLHLILEGPITTKPTPYFPCVPYSGADGTYHLGQAFLQAAFYGINWGKPPTDGIFPDPYMFLAQAPGPNIQSPVVKSIDPLDKAIQGYEHTTWEKSWQGHWQQLTEEQMFGPSTPSSLSTGAKVGIGVGVAAAVLFLAGGALFYMVRRRRWQSRTESFDPNKTPDSALSDKSVPIEADGRSLAAEKEGDSASVELPAAKRHMTQELPSANEIPAELPAD